jgi:hypothetical protein
MQRKPLYVDGVKGETAIGWIADALNTDGYLNAVQIIEPVDDDPFGELALFLVRSTSTTHAGTPPRPGGRPQMGHSSSSA